MVISNTRFYEVSKKNTRFMPSKKKKKNTRFYNT